MAILKDKMQIDNDYRLKNNIISQEKYFSTYILNDILSYVIFANIFKILDE